MKVQHIGLIEKCKRAMWQRQGEQPLLTTFWANDYRRGNTYWIDGRCYQITRYVRAADQRFFEVWGRAVQPMAATQHQSLSIGAAS